MRQQQIAFATGKRLLGKGRKQVCIGMCAGIDRRYHPLPHDFGDFCHLLFCRLS
jgi:hypothetical protein